LVCAVLMPLSSATVVLVACGLAERAGRREGFGVRAGQGPSTERPAPARRWATEAAQP